MTHPMTTDAATQKEGNCTPYMIFCTENIVAECGWPEATRNGVALTYALALRSAVAGADKPDWARINRAILDRWSRNALEYIKARAWKLAKGDIQP